jgi:hypothetical protein
MKIWVWLPIVLALAVVAARYFWQLRMQTRAQKEGMVLYATVISLEPVTVFGKPTPAMKIKLWLTEPDKTRREVSLTSRIPAGQTISPGMMLPIVVDPSDPKKVMPASAEAMKRVQLTGSREQRRQMRKQGM